MLKIQENVSEMLDNMSEPLIRDLRSFIDELQHNRKTGVNDYKFNSDLVQKFNADGLNENNLNETNGTEAEICDFNESVTNKIMTAQDICTVSK